MIHFDAVDFSERRSEEVMFLLTLSVYYKLSVESQKGVNAVQRCFVENQMSVITVQSLWW